MDDPDDHANVRPGHPSDRNDPPFKGRWWEALIGALLLAGLAWWALH